MGPKKMKSAVTCGECFKFSNISKAFGKGQMKLNLGGSSMKHKAPLILNTYGIVSINSIANLPICKGVANPAENNESLIRQMKVLLEKLELKVCPSHNQASRSPTTQSPVLLPRSLLSLRVQSQSTSERIDVSEHTNKLTEQINLLSQSACLNHIVNLLKV